MRSANSRSRSTSGTRAWQTAAARAAPRIREPARGARPVVHVSWIEISGEFLPWLNRKLGLSGASAYRLLTEAEWEYAARAGTTTKYAFGDMISTAQASFYAYHAVEVGSFAPNGFGLHDMHGNVAEWVQDCFEKGYGAAPVDGSAHSPGNCSSRVYRGGSWNDVPGFSAPRTEAQTIRKIGPEKASAWRAR